jgi:AbrB family looped-hinge helix DNA binding protein
MREVLSCNPVHAVDGSRKGQIVIPEDVRKRHRLRRGTDLVLLESGDALVLRKKADGDGILKDEFGPLLRASEEALRDLWENSGDDVWDDV